MFEISLELDKNFSSRGDSLWAKTRAKIFMSVNHIIPEFFHVICVLRVGGGERERGHILSELVVKGSISLY